MKLTPMSEWIPGLEHPLVIAGPCSAENEDQMLSTAKEIAKDSRIRVFRAGIWKPRTRPNCFEGIGEPGLAWLKKVKEETGLLISTEVANADHVKLALEYGVDILWIGARTSANPFSVQAIADALVGVDIPVMIKNPVNADLALWVGAIERIYGAGITKIAAVHRGFSTGDKSKYRNLPKWTYPIQLKEQLPDVPIICDPSHIAGRRDLVPEICQKAMDVGMDGLMVETHINPEVALSDKAQQVTPQNLKVILDKISLRQEYSDDSECETELSDLRAQIDRIDEEILEALKLRMDVVNKIGSTKKSYNITPLQIHRMDSLMKERTERAKSFGLKEDYIHDLFHVIHTESVKNQTEIMNEFDS